MKVEGLLFALVSTFLAASAVIYWIFSHDPTGTVCITLSGLFAFIIAYYVLFTAHRMDPRPEDRPDAEIADGAGEVGFFSPHSWWPIALGASFTITIVGLTLGPFLVVIGGLCLLISASGMLFEYYVGVNRSQAFTVGALQAIGEPPTSGHKFLGE